MFKPNVCFVSSTDYNYLSLSYLKHFYYELVQCHMSGIFLDSLDGTVYDAILGPYKLFVISVLHN